jgi:hypothetical protein
MATITNPKFWELLETPPDYAKHTTALYEWSLNFDAGKGPITLFLDLIGYSANEYGAPLFDLSKVNETLGYIELDYLGDALKEYADRPGDVMAWLEQLLGAEIND